MRTTLQDGRLSSFCFVTTIGHDQCKGDQTSDREQVVVVEGSRSSSIHVRSGVPQGSVLGPSLFLVYINDLPDQVISTSPLFADDTTVYRGITSDADTIILQSDLDALHEWEVKWDMSFHPDKCVVLAHSRKREAVKTNYTLHGKQLKQVSSTTILGVTCQDNCEYQEHINTIATKGNQLLGFLRRNLKIKNARAKAEGYLTLVRPSLEYASNVWDPHHQTDKEKLEKIQRRAARFVKNDYKTSSSVSAMINNLNWPLLEDRRKEIRLKMLQKIINGEVAVNHNNTIQPATSRSRRTHSYQLRAIASSRDYRRESFFP